MPEVRDKEVLGNFVVKGSEAKQALLEKGEMGCNGKACTECTQICLLMHGKKRDPSSPMVTSFFKVMIGDDFSEILFLPPKFARTVAALLGPKTYLEDSNGQRWEVTVSIVNGYFAFQQGWCDFSLSHGLEIGDFLVFHYITGSHFVVQIYGKSGCRKLDFGCQKLDFSGNNDRQKKRTRTNKGSMDKQGSSTSVVSKSRNVNDVGKVSLAMGKTSYFVNGSGLLIPRSEFAEETHYIIDRDIRNTEQEYRSSLFDLSIFEMPRPDGNNKVLGEKETSVRSQTEAVLVHKDPVCEAAGSLVAPSGAPRFAAFEKSNNSQVRDKLVLKIGKDSRTAAKLAKNRNVSLDTTNVVIKECDNAEKRNKDSSRTVERVKAGKKEQVEMIEELRHGKKPKIINECSQSIGLAVRDDVKVCKVVKTEPVDSIDYSPADAVNNVSLSVVVPDGQSFLELPTCLPSITKARMRMKAVILRDPVSRLWPLLYQDKYSFKILTSGWKAFCQGNNIQPGDACVFELENLPECIYKVGIVRK